MIVRKSYKCPQCGVPLAIEDEPASVIECPVCGAGIACADKPRPGKHQPHAAPPPPPQVAVDMAGTKIAQAIFAIAACWRFWRCWRCRKKYAHVLAVLIIPIAVMLLLLHSCSKEAGRGGGGAGDGSGGDSGSGIGSGDGSGEGQAGKDGDKGVGDGGDKPGEGQAGQEGTGEKETAPGQQGVGKTDAGGGKGKAEEPPPQRQPPAKDRQQAQGGKPDTEQETADTADGEGQITDEELKAVRQTAPKDKAIWATAIKRVDDMTVKAPGLTRIVPDFGAKGTEISHRGGIFEVKGFIVIEKDGKRHKRNFICEVGEDKTLGLFVTSPIKFSE